MIKPATPKRMLWILLLFHFFTGLADDVGITKARLIQVSEQSYLVEADVTQNLIWAIKSPVFPDRFQVSEPEYVTQSGWILIRMEAVTAGEPLSAEEEILLPWARNGVDLTVQGMDGTLHRGLFLRSLEGIRVPMHSLIPSRESLIEVCLEHFQGGILHLPLKWVHPAMITVIALFPRPFTSLLLLSFGQGLSLILSDLGFRGFDLVFVDVLGAILVFLLAHSALKKRQVSRFFPLLLFYGLLHGLAYSQEISKLELPLAQRLPALFTFNAAVDVGHFAGILLLLPLLKYLRKRPFSYRVVAYAVGTISVMSLALLFQQHVLAGKTDITGFRTVDSSVRFNLPTSPSEQAGGLRQIGLRRLTDPVMYYLSVGPYEVRQEILVKVKAAVEVLKLTEQWREGVPLESQERLKREILSLFGRTNLILIDGKESEPFLERADFVTLGPAGVTLRESPVPESLEEGILGLSLVYRTPELANQISLHWDLFSPLVNRVEATTVDPFGGATTILSPENRVLEWKRRLTGFKMPSVEGVVLEKQQLPLISILVFALTLGIFLYSLRRPQVAGPTVLLGLTGVGLLLYPFFRVAVDLPLAGRWKPSTEQTSRLLDGLLTNLYRSFDVREEGDVYDRLSVSVTGDQLTEIYLDSRRSLEFENRGGARATVEDVTVLSVGGVRRAGDGDFVADVSWTVAGSVDHFGHTHYRRNRYVALVTFTAVRNTWKIRNIDLVEEERLL